MSWPSGYGAVLVTLVAQAREASRSPSAQRADPLFLGSSTPPGRKSRGRARRRVRRAGEANNGRVIGASVGMAPGDHPF